MNPNSGFSAFRHRDFRLFWFGAVLSNTGTWMQFVTVPYVLDQLTHSTTWVGIASFCTYFPTMVVSPWAGSLADRYSRKTVLLYAQSVALCSALGLWLLWTTGQATAGAIVAVVVVGSIANGFTTAAWQAFVAQLVPPEDIRSAVRLNSMSFTGARAFGPAVAGLVLATLGAGAAFLTNAISFLMVIGALCLIAARPVVRSANANHVIAHLRDGLRYVRRRRVIVLAVVTAFVCAFFGVGIVQLTEPISHDLFGSGAGQYGLLVAAYGLGALIASLFTVARGDRYKRSTMSITGVALFVASVFALGFLSSFLVALPVYVLLGVAQILPNISGQTAVQVNIEEEYRGRVVSVYVMALFGGTPTGALTAGVLASLIGLRAAIFTFAIAFALVAILLAIRFNRFRPLDQSLPSIHDEHAEVPEFETLPADAETEMPLTEPPSRA